MSHKYFGNCLQLSDDVVKDEMFFKLLNGCDYYDVCKLNLFNKI